MPNRPRDVLLCDFDEFRVYDFDTDLDTPKDTVATKDLLAQLLALNQQVAAKIEKGESVMPAGVPKNYPDAKKLVTEDCIKPCA